MPDYIYALHDPGGEYLFADKPGFIVFTEAIGSDPSDKTGRDYRQWSDAGYGVLVRVNNGYGSAGTIPAPNKYRDFAKRFANFVAASQGADRWIVANEPNHSQERPNGQTITPHMYIDCFRQVHDAVVEQAGTRHGLIPAPVALWNVETGDWLAYQEQIWQGLWQVAGGIAIHTYTHGAAVNLITSQERMGAPYQDRYYHFQAYRQFMQRIPDRMSGLPVYITETDQNDPWVDANTGWVQAAYDEIDRWNATPGTQKIHCLALYRWPKFDQWSIVDKPGVHADFRAAVARGFRIPKGGVPSQPDTSEDTFLPEIKGGAMPATLPAVAWDPRLTKRGIELTQYQPKPGEKYWRVVRGEYWEEKEHTFAETIDESGKRLPGVKMHWWWADGDNEKVTELKPGDRWMVDFPMFAHGKSYGLEALGYPSDKLWGMGLGSWEQPDWNIHVSYKFVFQLTTAGSQPETAVGDAPKPPQVKVPPLTHPIQNPALRLISQRFGENPEDYTRFGLAGHTGLDFAVPTGTPVVAVDGGVVQEAGQLDDFGIYVKLRHPWGESVYAHLSRFRVEHGEAVNKGYVIGYSGNTGNSTGPHLHLGIRVNPYKRGAPYDGYSNPEQYLPKVAAPQPSPSVDILSIIKAAAQEFKVDWQLLASLSWAESSWRSDAVSSAGAKGLFQIMDSTFNEWGQRIGAGSVFNPKDNARVGAAYLAHLIKHFNGDVRKGLWAYNYGVGSISSGRTPPQETIEFASKVLHGYDLLRAIRA